MTDRDRPGSEPTAAETVVAGYQSDQPTIRRAVGASDPAVRCVAIGALLRSGTLDPAGLRTFVGDPEPIVRRRAAELAHRLPESCELEIDLSRLLGDEPEIAEMAVFALGEIGSTRCELDPDTVALIEAMASSHDDPLCREAAVAALGALHTGLETILAACADRATVRRRAVIALAPFDGPRVEAALRTALTDRDWQVRQAAEDLLADPPSDPPTGAGA